MMFFQGKVPLTSSTRDEVSPSDENPAAVKLALSVAMAKARSRHTLIKLVSTAKTGFMRYVYRPRTAPLMKQVRYDPIVMRHVLFEEGRKRKLPQATNSR